MLKGERVLLRAVTADDLPRLCAFRNDFALHVLVSEKAPVPQTLAQIEAEFAASARDVPDEAWFAVEADGVLIGTCLLFHFDRLSHHCELGITLGDPAYQGHGYGREVIGLLLDYGFRLLNLSRIWLMTTSGNERALRCYRACGFVEEGRLRRHAWINGAYEDVIYMGILREEFLSGR
jgi:RimJ/RimL family protein N-acetyltransferase